MRSFSRPTKGGSLLDWCGKAWDAIRRNRIKAGPGILLSQNSDGTTISLRPGNKSSAGAKPALYASISSETAGETTTYHFTITPGYVISRGPKTGNAIETKKVTEIYVDPGADPLVFKKHTVTNGQAVYVKFTTDKKGKLTGDPEVVVDEDDKESTHYFPDGGDGGGAAGTYYHRLAVAEIIDDKAKTKDRISGNIDHYAELPTHINVGGKSEVAKEFEISAGEYKYRTIDGREEVDADPGDAEAEPPVAPTDAIVQQIKVEQDGDLIRVKGNDKKGKFTFIQPTGSALEIPFDDGLIDTESSGTFRSSWLTEWDASIELEGAPGAIQKVRGGGLTCMIWIWSQQVWHANHSFPVVTDPGSSPIAKIYVLKGVIMGTTKPDPYPASVPTFHISQVVPIDGSGDLIADVFNSPQDT